MKTKVNELLLICCLAAFVPFFLAAESKNKPKQKIVLSVGDAFWSVEDLIERSKQHLIEKGSMKKGVAVNSTVYVQINQSSSLCRILHTQEFGAPAWEVIIGTSGKVQGFDKFILMEGMPKLPKRNREAIKGFE